VTKEVAEKFLDALATNDSELYEELLTEDAGIRIGRWDGSEAYRPRRRVIERLRQESSGWNDARVLPLNMTATKEHVAIEFRIQVTENSRYVEHNRAAFLTLKDGKVRFIDLYCPEPIPSARRGGDWIAPASMTAAELLRFFDSFEYKFDVREWLPMNIAGKLSQRLLWTGSGDPHPGSNRVGNARWSAEEADRRVEEIIAYYRERNAGFTWFTGPFDSPSDMRARLEKHGLALAGEAVLMVRLGLNNLNDIPTNPNVEIELLDGSNDESLEAAVQIMAVSFHLTPDQVEERRPSFFDRVKNPEFRKWEISHLARLEGKPVAGARLILRGGVAYLGGASTLSEYRGRKIYSTLLRHRLEIARDRHYEIAAIHAEPMSRRVVSKFGFNEIARYYLYGWMPVIDMDVIRSLVPDE
jgi:GNAT superfamily N-acetyltransferase